MQDWPLPEGVRHVKRCALRVGAGRWAFAHDEAIAIDRHWGEAQQREPSYFNGSIHLLREMTLADDGLAGTLIGTDFKSFLYWRARDFPAAGVLDAFGSALIVGSDGGIVLGLQRAGNINAGRLYLPGGFIDPRDIGADGAVDLGGSVARELVEETGLVAGRDVVADDGYFLTRTGAHVSIAVRYRASEPAARLAERVRCRLADDPASELADVKAVHSTADLDRFDVPEFARCVVGYVLAAG